MTMRECYEAIGESNGSIIVFNSEIRMSPS